MRKFEIKNIRSKCSLYNYRYSTVQQLTVTEAVVSTYTVRGVELQQAIDEADAVCMCVRPEGFKRGGDQRVGQGS